MSTLVNEQTPFTKQPNNFVKLTNPQRDLVGDTNVDLEFNRLRIWNHNDQLLRFGRYYKDEIVKSPFALYYQMEINKYEILCLKITTTLRDCWGTKCQTIPLNHTVRHTPYLFWIYNPKYLHFPTRVCFECMNDKQREMIRLIYNVT